MLNYKHDSGTAMNHVYTHRLGGYYKYVIVTIYLYFSNALFVIISITIRDNYNTIISYYLSILIGPTVLLEREFVA